MKEIIPQTEVLARVAEAAPHLELVAERAWLWCASDVRGDSNAAARDVLKSIGFRFAKKGHALPDGRIAYWAHSCDAPRRSIRKGDGSKSKPAAADQGVIHTESEWDRVRKEAMAFFNPVHPT